MTRANEPQQSSYLFGPVQSRRLGRSLGIDIIPHKICSLDCVYCECGLTTGLTARRAEFADIEEVAREVQQRLATGAEVDYLTVTGAGEPTLHTGIGRLIGKLKQMSRIPVAVLTNGTLLGDEQVQRDLRDADLVLPSLDAGTEEEYGRVNRPATGLTLEGLVAGMERFRGVYRGQIWLEVLLVGGATDSEESVRRIAALARRVGADRVQLNTVARPPAEPWARSVSMETMGELATLFTPPAEVVASAPRGCVHSNTTTVAVARSDVVAMVRRRPCPLAEIASGLGVSEAELRVHLTALVDAGVLRISERGGVAYYVAR